MDCKSLSVCNVVIFYIAIVFSQDATLYLSCDNTCATALNNIGKIFDAGDYVYNACIFSRTRF